MFGICGYYTKENRPAFDEAIIRDMCKGFYPCPNDRIEIITGEGYAIGVANGSHATINSNNNYRAFITGFPYWKKDVYRELAAQKGDAYALIDAFIKHQHEAFNLINGQFSSVIIDETSGNIIVAVDRMGIQPISYTKKGDCIVFGSTADCVKYFSKQSSSINHQAILDYMFFHMIPSPRSIYTEQKKLLPATYLSYGYGNEQVNNYWLPSFSEQESINLDEHVDLLQKHLEDSVFRNISQNETGSFLSGGLDSTTVSGMLAKRSNQANTFTIGFDAEGYDEIEYARIAEKHYGLNSHEYYVTPKDVADSIQKIASYYDEPYGNSSAIPAYYCALMAKENGISTLLAGDGGDEIFAGNERYSKQLVFESYKTVPPMIRNKLIEPIFLKLLKNYSFYPLNKAKSYITQANIPMPERLESYNHLLRDELSNIFTNEFSDGVTIKEPIKLLNDVYYKIPDISTLNRMMYLDWKQTLADNDLRKVNKMCYLGGVDVRYPMLDTELVDYSINIPSTIKLKGDKLRYFYKYCLRDFLPSEILNKPKQGFGLPFGVWLRTSKDLREIVNDSLSSFRSRNIIKSEYLDWLLDKHETEHAAFHGTTVWVIMMLELWFQNHTD